jgi:uncharacterized membrane protein YkvA (DUF1232 family)
MEIQFSQFDSETRRIVEQLSEESLVPVNVLSDELQQYDAELEIHSSNAGMFDAGIAKRISSLCWQLLEALPPKPDERQHRLTQLAINYFVLAEDAHDDNHSLMGFEDDLQVVTAVINELGLDHLLTEDQSKA